MFQVKDGATAGAAKEADFVPVADRARGRHARRGADRHRATGARGHDRRGRAPRRRPGGRQPARPGGRVRGPGAGRRRASAGARTVDRAPPQGERHRANAGAAATPRRERSDCPLAHEHPAYRHQPPGHDVHAERGHRPARRDLAAAPAGRPDAGAAASRASPSASRYPGVGPREMEESITRPIEQAVSAVAGLEQVNATSAEGQSIIRLNFAWGTNLNVAADDVRSRIDRVRARLPEEADAPIVFKFDSTAFPILFLAVEGDFDAVTLRDIAENTLAQRLERVPGRRRRQRQRRPAPADPVELSREKMTALGPVGRPHHQPADDREPEHAARRGLRRRPRPTCCAARASSPTSTRSATWSC